MLDSKTGKHIYELCNLTYNEVLVIDKDFSMSEEEYNNFKI